MSTLASKDPHKSALPTLIHPLNLIQLANLPRFMSGSGGGSSGGSGGGGGGGGGGANGNSGEVTVEKKMILLAGYKR